jgi:hypothetical protein
MMNTRIRLADARQTVRFPADAGDRENPYAALEPTRSKAAQSPSMNAISCRNSRRSANPARPLPSPAVLTSRAARARLSIPGQEVRTDLPFILDPGPGAARQPARRRPLRPPASGFRTACNPGHALDRARSPARSCFPAVGRVPSASNAMRMAATATAVNRTFNLNVPPWPVRSSGLRVENAAFCREPCTVLHPRFSRPTCSTVNLPLPPCSRPKRQTVPSVVARIDEPSHHGIAGYPIAATNAIKFRRLSRRSQIRWDGAPRCPNRSWDLLGRPASDGVSRNLIALIAATPNREGTRLTIQGALPAAHSLGRMAPRSHVGIYRRCSGVLKGPRPRLDDQGRQSGPTTTRRRTPPVSHIGRPRDGQQTLGRRY